jgi:integrase
MVNRSNYLDVQSFLEYQVEVRQNCKGTAQAQWSRLRMLLEWADEKPFSKMKSIHPAFTAYIEGRRGKNGQLLGSAHLTATCKTCQAFLRWVKREHPGRYRSLADNWIETIRPSRGRSEQSELHTRQLYALDEVRRLMEVEARTTAERRLRAGVAFLFMSGMRIGAFMTLPVECVDLKRLQVKQLPQKGVKTKNSKAAITWMLNIPDLLKVARAWDGEVRSVGCRFWYAHLDAFGELTQDAPTGDRSNVRGDFGEALRALCERVGVEYYSAHKLRHGHAVYALKHAKTMAELKAISQNLMHSSIGITDGIYGRLVDDDVNRVITHLGT